MARPSRRRGCVGSKQDGKIAVGEFVFVIVAIRSRMTPVTLRFRHHSAARFIHHVRVERVFSAFGLC